MNKKNSKTHETALASVLYKITSSIPLFHFFMLTCENEIIQGSIVFGLSPKKKKKEGFWLRATLEGEIYLLFDQVCIICLGKYYRISYLGKVRN